MLIFVPRISKLVPGRFPSLYREVNTEKNVATPPCICPYCPVSTKTAYLKLP